MTIKIAYIRCWKMSGANEVNFIVCTCFDANFANSFWGQNGSGECRLCNSHFLVEKPKCEQLCLKANVLKRLKIIYMVWRSYFLSCTIQHQQPRFSAAPTNAQEMTAMVCMVEPEQQLSTREEAAAATLSSVEHPSYKLVSTFLQDGDAQRGGWSVTKHGVCHFEPKIPSGGGQKSNTRLFCTAIWGCFGFYFLLFHTHSSYLNSSLMPSAFPFSVHLWVFAHAHHFKDKFLNSREWVQMTHPFLAKLIYHQDQSNFLLQDVFPGGSPAS